MNHFSITIHPRGDEYQVNLDENWDVISAVRFLPSGDAMDYPCPQDIPHDHRVQIEQRAEWEKRKTK